MGRGKFALITSASALAIAIATGGGAVAADAVYPAPTSYGPPVGQLYDWSGHYIGVHGGLGWAGFQSGTDGTENNIDGGIAGLHLGSNWQREHIVYGIEGDISGANIFAGGSTRNTHIDALASIRGRLGVAFDRILVYGTGGAGYVDGVIGSSSGDSQADISELRGVVGGGVEFAPIDNVSFRAETLAFVGSDSFDISGSTWTLDTVWVTRLGMSYHF